MDNFLPFSLSDIGEEEIYEILDSLKSGWLTTGPKARSFEEEFAAFIGSGVEAIAVNSATAGLHLALEAAGVGPGDEVITTPYTFTATAEVSRYLGAETVLPHGEADLGVTRILLIELLDGDDPGADLVIAADLALGLLADQTLSALIGIEAVISDLADMDQAVQRTEAHERTELDDLDHIPLNQFAHDGLEDDGLVANILVDCAVTVHDAAFAYAVNITDQNGHYLAILDPSFKGRPGLFQNDRLQILTESLRGDADDVLTFRK